MGFAVLLREAATPQAVCSLDEQLGAGFKSGFAV